MITRTQKPGWREIYALCALLVVSAGARLFICLSGGRFFLPDEQRYHEAEAAIRLLLDGNVGGAFAPGVMGVEHIGYKFLSLIPAYFSARAGIGPEAASVFFGLFSVASIWAVWSIARRGGQDAFGALLAALFMATATTNFYYARHLTPYDAALFLGLMGVRSTLGKPTLRGAFLAGLFSGSCFMTYNGYWSVSLLPPLVGLWGVPALLREKGYKSVFAHYAVMGAGFLLAIAGMLVVTGRTPTWAWAEYKAFAATITMGDYEEGWIFPLAYLWEAEKGMLVLWLCGVAALATSWFRRKAGFAGRWLLPVAVLYVCMGAASAWLHVFVVYGRVARLLTPFLCLAAAAGFQALASWSNTSQRLARVLPWVACLALVPLTFRQPLVQVFPTEFENTLAKKYARYLQREGFFVFSERHLPSAHSVPCDAVVLEQTPNPNQWKPYQFEGFNSKDRAFMQRLDFAMRLIKCVYDRPGLNIDLLGGAFPPDGSLSNIDDNNLLQYGVPTRWLMGPIASLEFWASAAHPSTVALSMVNNLFPEQDVVVFINGVFAAQKALPGDDLRSGGVQLMMPFTPKVGLNRMDIVFARWNNKDGVATVPDDRPLAAALLKCTIQRDAPKAE